MQRHQLRIQRYSTHYLYMDQRFERLDFSIGRDGKTQKKLFHRILAANIFHRSLSSHSGRAGEDQSGIGRIESAKQGDHGLIVGERKIVGSAEEFLGFVRVRMQVHNG